MEQTKIDVVQMNVYQAQLEEAVGIMSQEMSTIKELFERLFIPQVPAAVKSDNAVEEQQAAKTTTRGKVASARRMNSQRVPQSRAESTQSAISNSKKTNTKAGPSKPYNEVVLGLPLRFEAPLKSQEKERTRGGPKPTRNVFDQLGQKAKEDLRVHLDDRQTSASSKKNNVPLFFPMHAEINELRKWLDKLAA